MLEEPNAPRFHSRTTNAIRRIGQTIGEPALIYRDTFLLNRNWQQFKHGKISEETLRRNLRKLDARRINISEERLSLLHGTVSTLSAYTLVSLAHGTFLGQQWKPFGNGVAQFDAQVAGHLQQQLGSHAYDIVRLGTGAAVTTVGAVQGFRGRGAPFTDIAEAIGNVPILTKKQKESRFRKIGRTIFRGGIPALRTIADVAKYKTAATVALAEKTVWPQHAALAQTMGIPEGLAVSAIAYTGLAKSTTSIPALLRRVESHETPEPERRKLERFLEIARNPSPDAPRRRKNGPTHGDIPHGTNLTGTH